ncbi:helix-turn-helix domain-containing protein [Streptomyces mexicanus]|uniref:helix-turn-helix domain-containing protein n=1 Tax=Streptomyces mexicanus TaxID=178566 RepID=UPI00368E7F2D
MGRQPRPVEAPHPALAALAADLRRLREQSGSPPYRRMAAQANYSASSLSEAASGRRLPSKAVVMAYARACGADPQEWAARWSQVANEVEQPAVIIPQPEPRSSPAVTVDASKGEAPPKPRERSASKRRRLWLLSAASLVAVGLAAAGSVLLLSHKGHAAQVEDGQDPYVHGCGRDQRPMERQPVYRADGTAYGYVVLFYSPSCSAAWGYVLGPNSPRWRVYVSAHRIDDGHLTTSSFQGTARPNSWGDALSTTSGCVRAEAWVDHGPRAVTSCWRSEGAITTGLPGA